MLIRIKKDHDDAIVPQYQTSGAAAFDLHACENFTILPGQTVAVDTGLIYEIPEGFELQVRPRSGLAHKHNIHVANSPGTVDSDYRGRVKVLLYNASPNNFAITSGDRIAQGAIQAVIRAEFELSEELSETVRGAGGFGHTGK